jgi:hypothetical protein
METLTSNLDSQFLEFLANSEHHRALTVESGFIEVGGAAGYPVPVKAAIRIGTVKSLKVQPEQIVEREQTLVEIE